MIDKEELEFKIKQQAKKRYAQDLICELKQDLPPSQHDKLDKICKLLDIEIEYGIMCPV